MTNSYTWADETAVIQFDANNTIWHPTPPSHSQRDCLAAFSVTNTKTASWSLECGTENKLSYICELPLTRYHCPHGWTDYTSDKCIKRHHVSQQLKHVNASQRCKNIGGKLPEPRSWEENNQLGRHVKLIPAEGTVCLGIRYNTNKNIRHCMMHLESIHFDMAASFLLFGYLPAQQKNSYPNNLGLYVTLLHFLGLTVDPNRSIMSD